jgi:phage major head subunit gpT-like protein
MKFIEATSTEKTKLQESNEKIFSEAQTENTKHVLKEVASEFGIKNPEQVFDFTRRDFSVKKFREGAYRVASLKEAQSELALGQLLRAGVNNQFNKLYVAAPVTYTAVVIETSSNKRQEFHAPIERAGFPKRIERQGNFPERSFKSLDIEIVNQKFGFMLAFERELFDDDQTGQVVQLSGQMGENFRIFEEAYVWAKYQNAASTLDGEPLPVSSTYSTVYSTTGIHGTGLGINATSPARISQSQIQAGYILAKKMVDQSGRPITVMPSVLAVSPQDIFFAEVLLNSEYNPSKASSATGDDGKVGGAFSKNPIKSLAAVVSTRFLNDYAALLIDPKAFAFQRRDATEVIQENPQSGPAFSQEVFRYKARARFEADFIDPKFSINLNTSFAST